MAFVPRKLARTWTGAGSRRAEEDGRHSRFSRLAGRWDIRILQGDPIGGLRAH